MRLDDFRGQCFNIRGNFLYKFVARQRLLDATPFAGQVEFDGYTLDLTELEIVRQTPHNLQIRIQELQGDMIRSLLDDTWRAHERYLTVLHAHLEGRPMPEFDADLVNRRMFLDHQRVSVEPDEREFLEFFNRVRNCLMHFEGRYSVRQRIDYVYQGFHFQSQGKESQPLEIGLGLALAIHEDLREIVTAIIRRSGLDSV